MKFVKFIDLIEPGINYGYFNKELDGIVCACCGSLFPMDEEHESFEILDTYEANLEDIIRREMEG